MLVAKIWQQPKWHDTFLELGFCFMTGGLRATDQ
jgi:hypothetical protein